LVLVAALAAACTGPGAPPDNPGTTSPATSAPPAFDPPRAFADDPVNLGEAPGRQYAIDGTRLYRLDSPDRSTQPTRLVAVDLATGDEQWSNDVDENRIAQDESPIRLATVDGKALVFVTYLVELKGTGTRPDRQLLRVRAFQTADGAQVWSADIDAGSVPGVAGKEFSWFSPPRIVAASQDHLAIDANRWVIVLDAHSGAVRWGASDFRLYALDRDVVVGISGRSSILDDYVSTGRSAVDGRELWKVERLHDDVQMLGAGLVALRGSYRKANGDFQIETSIVDITTGEARVTLGAGYFCRHDTVSLVVCWNDRFYNLDDHLVAIDMQTAKTLWELPTNDRIVPGITYVHKGLIYARTDNGAFLMDARTGADREGELSVEPIRVVPGYGFTINRNDVVFAYRATA
jgi:outer membrane protein assembly factor BamB